MNYVVFKTLNSTIEKNKSKIEIKNWLSSSQHWSEKLLFEVLDKIDFNLQVLSKNNNPSDFLLFCVDILRANPRIQDLKLFKDENNNFVFLFSSNVRNIGDVAPFERTISFTNKFVSFKFVELACKPEEIDSIKIPENWKLEELLTNKIKKYNRTFIDR